MSDSRIRMAIVGCGGMSRAFVDHLHLLEDRMVVTALVDVERERAEHAAESWPGAKVETDYRNVLDDCDVGLLVLPHHLHHPIGKEFLLAGKDVLLEKPLALNEEECQDLIATADREKRILMVAYVMRYHPLVVAMKEAMDDGVIGDVFQISIWTEQYTRYPVGHWGLDASKLGGGQLFSHGCHYVDLLLWMLGEPVQGTHMGSNFGVPWMEREGTSNLTMSFASGAMGYHFGTWGARGSKLRRSFHAHGTKGMLDADFSEGTLNLLRNTHIDGLVGPDELAEWKEEDSGHLHQKVLYKTPTHKQTDKEVVHFLDCVASRQTPMTSGPDALRSLRVIWRMYEAEKQGVVADLRGV